MLTNNGPLARRIINTLNWAVEKHVYHANLSLALCLGQVEHLCLDLEAPYRTCLRLLPCHQKDQSTVASYARANPWNTGKNSRFGDTLAWTELHGACIPACVSLPGCRFGDPPVGEVTKINLLFASRPWFCGCSCVLPVPAHTSGVGGRIQEQLCHGRQESRGLLLIILFGLIILFENQTALGE